MAFIEKPIWSEDGNTLTNVLVNDILVTYNRTDLWYDGTPIDDSKLDSDLVYVKYEGKYLVRNFEYGQVLQKDTMQEMRDLSSYEILLLKMGVYKHVQLNGYYEKGDTPSPINYTLSDTQEVDDGGSVIDVGAEKLKHEFKGFVDIRYYGVKEGDVIQDVVNDILNKYLYVEIPNGTYFIDVTKQSDAVGRKGIAMNDGSHLKMSEETYLKALPNGDGRYSMIDVIYRDNVKIEGGNIEGDREEHEGDEGEWGHGINLWSSSNVTIKDVKISKFWGDGIYIGGVDGTALYGATTISSENEAIPSQRILVENVEVDFCRRQGISITCGKEVVIRDSDIKRTEGVAPQALIDIEPNRREGERYGYVEGLIIEDSHFTSGETQGITCYHLSPEEYPIRQVVVERCYFEGNGRTHLAIRRSKDVVVKDNIFINSNDLGSGGQVSLSGGNVKFVNNKVIKGVEGVYSVRIWSESLPVSVEVEGNTIINEGGSHVRFEEGLYDQVTISKNTFEGSSISYFSYKSSNNYKNIAIERNLFKSVTPSVFQILSSITVEDLSFKGNEVLSSSTIDIRDNYEGVDIDGNIFTDIQSTVVSVNGAKEVNIHGNLFRGCVGGRVLYCIGESSVNILSNRFYRCNTTNEIVYVSNSVKRSIVNDNYFLGDDIPKVPMFVSDGGMKVVGNNTVEGYTIAPNIGENVRQYGNIAEGEYLSKSSTSRYGVVKSSESINDENTPDADDLDSTIDLTNSLKNKVNEVLSKLRVAGLIEE